MDKEFRVIEERILSDNWGRLQSVTFEIKRRNGEPQQHTQEMYDVGDGAAILLYNRDQGTVILNHQFRLVTVYNKNPGGMLVEVCAGKVEDGLSPEATVQKEALEETGYNVTDIKLVTKLYMSPGSFTELLYFYVGCYRPSDRPGHGGGNEDEGEDIEINEVPFSKAMEMVATGEIKDAKTVILLQYAKLNGLLD
jgi:nudix-type nucleoside diphosphatase (YffH/AdpP family)